VDGERGAWLVRWPRTAAPAVRLVCFAHAGAGASRFRRWATAVPERVEVCAVRLPGRESRLWEPALRGMDELVAAALPALAEALEPPFALFGHCLGALIAFELARELARLRRPRPLLLAAAGQVAPSRHAVPPDERASDPRERLRRQAASDDPVLVSDRLYDAVRPTIEADFRLVDGYTYRPAPALDVPLAIFAGGAGDPAAAAWARETRAGCVVRALPAEPPLGDEAWSRLGLAVAAELAGR
jgi:medium-chain acyl-[acyl-carrier-protein] hydrolase